MGAPVGNSNATKAKPWADAIKRALARREQTGSGADLNALADKLIDSAAEGDMAALKELGDRLDGKPAQALVGDSGFDPVQISQVHRVIVDPRNPDAKGI